LLAKAVCLGVKNTRGSGILGDVVGMMNPTAGMSAKAVGFRYEKN
jgi:hypothetical protein